MLDLGCLDYMSQILFMPILNTKWYNNKKLIIF